MTQAEENREFNQNTGVNYRKVIVWRSFDELLKHENTLPSPRTPEDLVQLDSRQFVYLTNTYGKDSCIAVITIALTRTCQYLNLDISAPMVHRAAEIISEDFSDCKFADLQLFDRWVLSLSEKLYRLDTRELVDLFKRYYGYRQEAFSVKAEQDHIARMKGEVLTDEEQEFLHYVRKFKPQLLSEYMQSNHEGDFESFCRMKYKPVENPRPVQYDLFRPIPKMTGLSVRDLAAKHGVDFDERLSKAKKQWTLKYHNSSISEFMSFEDFMRYETNAFQVKLRKELEAV